MNKPLITPKTVLVLLKLEVADLYLRLMAQGIATDRARAICAALEKQQLATFSETALQRIEDDVAGLPTGDGYRLSSWKELREALPDGLARLLQPSAQPSSPSQP